MPSPRRFSGLKEIRSHWNWSSRLGLGGPRTRKVRLFDTSSRRRRVGKTLMNVSQQPGRGWIITNSDNAFGRGDLPKGRRTRINRRAHDDLNGRNGQWHRAWDRKKPRSCRKPWPRGKELVHPFACRAWDASTLSSLPSLFGSLLGFFRHRSVCTLNPSSSLLYSLISKHRHWGVGFDRGPIFR